MSRWVIHAEATFDASHALSSYRGRPESSHEHSWRVAVRVGTDALNEEGYALDFHQVETILGAAVRPLVGTDLNRHPEIGTPSPTAERIAEVLSETLTVDFEKIGGRLLTVSVWEGPDNRVDLTLSDDAR
jgi:6-pyruvoyltetrahydropterin/6-carboxytetrahydropterin synthase